MNVVAGRAVGVAGTLGVVGDPVKAGKLVARVASGAVRCGIDRRDVRLVAGCTFAMSFRARRQDLLVTAGAGYRQLQLMSSALVARLAARMLGNTAGLPYLRRVALGAQSALRDIAQVKVMRFMAIGALCLGGVEGAFGPGLFVAARASKREL